MEQDLVFDGRNIPVADVAKIMGKDPQFIRLAMINKLLPIGLAYKKEGSSQYDFYISPKLFYEYMGYKYKVLGDTNL